MHVHAELEARKGRVGSEASVSVACDDSLTYMGAAGERINEGSVA